jgi:acetolactate synthase regulatory subunit
MKHRLTATLGTEPGALQRVLVTAARRGFEPVAVVAHKNTECFTVELEVESDRPAALLARALEKLFDVLHVEVVVS